MKAVTMGAAKATRHVSCYNSFVGVDFSTDPMLVDKNHSPYALNLVADDGGMPEKRPGWRTLLQLEGKINGLFYCMIDGQEHCLCHAGTKLWKVDIFGGETPTVLLAEPLFDGPSRSFFMKVIYLMQQLVSLSCSLIRLQMKAE